MLLGYKERDKEFSKPFLKLCAKIYVFSFLQVIMKEMQLIVIAGSFRVSLFIDLEFHEIWRKGGRDTLALL